jgi:hypothetical protein
MSIKSMAYDTRCSEKFEAIHHPYPREKMLVKTASQIWDSGVGCGYGVYRVTYWGGF